MAFEFVKNIMNYELYNEESATGKTSSGSSTTNGIQIRLNRAIIHKYYVFSSHPMRVALMQFEKIMHFHIIWSFFSTYNQ